MSCSTGFFTVATGDEQYYRMAANLLHSYRYFSKNPLPFAILADRENAYTKDFDQVILLEHPTNSYLDKLALFDYLPFDVSVFIDADCLAYGDLNEILRYFQSADDFSCFGRVLPLEDKTGWFNYEDLGELQLRVSYCVGLHGGIYYIRRSDLSKSVFDTAKQISKDYDKYHFKGKFSTPGDEPILALSMALNKCRPVPHDTRAICCYWEHVGRMALSVSRGRAYIQDQEKCTLLVHWGTRFTEQFLYQKQVAELDLLRSGESAGAIAFSNMKYEWKIKINCVKQFAMRVRNKLKRMAGVA